MIFVNVQRLRDAAHMPQQMTPGSAGYDIYMPDDMQIDLRIGGTATIPTGLAMAIPHGYVGKLFVRSSLGTKQGIRIGNGTGIIDSDYRGEIMVCLHKYAKGLGLNVGTTIEPGERFAQIVFERHEIPNLIEVDNLEKTHVRAGGFGSTGS